MVELFGKNYYIDIDGITEKCQTSPSTENDGEADPLEINLIKFEVVKVCLERVLNEYEDTDEELGPIAEKSLPISFKIAFNTLIKYGILIEDDEQ